MSDSNVGTFQPPPPPADAPAPRPTYLRMPAIVLAVLGCPDSPGRRTQIYSWWSRHRLALAFWGALLFGLSFVRLPKTALMRRLQCRLLDSLTGIFYEPTRVFQNLKFHPTLAWSRSL